MSANAFERVRKLSLIAIERRRFAVYRNPCQRSSSFARPRYNLCSRCKATQPIWLRIRTESTALRQGPIRVAASIPSGCFTGLEVMPEILA